MTSTQLCPDRGYRRTGRVSHPIATVDGVKVVFLTATILVRAEAYAAANNPRSYDTSNPDNPGFAIWYTWIKWITALDQRSLDEITGFAAGNNRHVNSDPGVQPVTSHDRVITTVTTDPCGAVPSSFVGFTYDKAAN